MVQRLDVQARYAAELRERGVGELDVPAHREVWAVELQQEARVDARFPRDALGPLLATAGDVFFAGGTNDRKFRAFDATNGKVFCEYPASSGVSGIPTSFEIDGEQYVAVLSGWGVDAQSHAERVRRRAHHQTVVPAGGTVLFKLEKN